MSSKVHDQPARKLLMPLDRSECSRLNPAGHAIAGEALPAITSSKAYIMLETIAVLLIILWLLGLLTSFTLGGLIHVLLVIALVVIVLRLISGRRI